MNAPKELKPFPVFKTDEEAEKFVDEADLSEYDFSQFKPARFEFAKKSEPRTDHSGRFPGLALASALRSRSQAESYAPLSM